MLTRSRARCQLIAEAGSKITVDELQSQAMEGVAAEGALIRGRATKKRRREEDGRVSAIKRRKSELTLIGNDSRLERQIDRVGDENNGLLGKDTPSIRASKRGRQGKSNQQSEEGTPTIGMSLRGLPGSCQMTAKMRWKNRARTMIKETETDLSPSSAPHSPSKEQNVASQDFQISPSVNDSLPHRIDSPEASRLSRKRRLPSARSKNQKRNSKITGTKPTLKEAMEQRRKAKGRLRVCGQQIEILKRLKSFLQARSACENEANVPEATDLRFVMTENDREDLVQKMVERCRKDANLRSSFLDSVKVLAKGGVMHSAALSLWQECPCEETEELIKAWEEFKLQHPTTKGSPMDLLEAVNKLHEKRPDLSGKFTRFEDAGFCSLRQICDGTWQIQLRE